MTSDVVSAAVDAAYEAVRYRMPWLTLDQFRKQAKLGRSIRCKWLDKWLAR